MESYYKTLHEFKMHGYSIDELEGLIPFEITVFRSLIRDYHERLEEKRLQAQQAADALGKARF